MGGHIPAQESHTLQDLTRIANLVHANTGSIVGLGMRLLLSLLSE